MLVVLLRSSLVPTSCPRVETSTKLLKPFTTKITTRTSFPMMLPLSKLLLQSNSTIKCNQFLWTKMISEVMLILFSVAGVGLATQATSQTNFNSSIWSPSLLKTAERNKLTISSTLKSAPWPGPEKVLATVTLVVHWYTTEKLPVSSAGECHVPGVIQMSSPESASLLTGSKTLWLITKTYANCRPNRNLILRMQY